MELCDDFVLFFYQSIEIATLIKPNTLILWVSWPIEIQTYREGHDLSKIILVSNQEVVAQGWKIYVYSQLKQSFHIKAVIWYDCTRIWINFCCPYASSVCSFAIDGLRESRRRGLWRSPPNWMTSITKSCTRCRDTATSQSFSFFFVPAFFQPLQTANCGLDSCLRTCATTRSYRCTLSALSSDTIVIVIVYRIAVRDACILRIVLT